jgi:hypothetical protein
MSAKKRITRRELLKGTGTALLGTLLGRCTIAGMKHTTLAQDPTLTPMAYLPLVRSSKATPTPSPSPTPPPGTPRVVHVHDPDATSWSGSGWYGNAVNQSVVDSMVQTGLQNLTGESSWADIWNDIFSRVQPSGYQAGQGIAIKVNFNNSSEGCGDNDTEIDALPHPVKALIAALKQANVREQDIWIYDATKGGRYIPDRFRTPILSSHPSVAFYGKGSCTSVNPARYDHVDTSLELRFSDPDGNLLNRWLPDLLYEATYLINMPILKEHGIHPVSLGFKNHFGSINRIIGAGNDDLHYYISPTNSLYEATYSPMVDIFSNPNIKDKTVLTLGDGLYGAPGATRSPVSWSTFDDDYPNSLFFATDPVAVDCVMADFVKAQWPGGIMDQTHDYLFCAQEAGFGTCEGTRDNPGGNPWQLPYGSGYSDIQYVRIDR